MSSNIAQDELLGLYERLQSKRDRLKEQLDEVEKEFEAVSTTLRLIGQVTPGEVVNLEGMTQLEALIAIARANGNRLTVKRARRLMIKAGYFKNSKHPASVLFTAINRSGKFEREMPGVYRLIEKKEEEPVRTSFIAEPVAS